jgi:tetratricopeptide (TPR) repeat protein
LHPTVVQDLASGEVLFYFYQEDYFSALSRLLAAQSRSELPNHAGEAELLLGGLYLSYGQHRLAGQLFEQLLEGAVEPELHDRAWFFLAKIWHQRGYLAEAEAALGRIHESLPEELEPERHMLHAQVLMDQGRFAEALTLLEAWPKRRARWVAYAKYNIGVALVRLGQVEAGAAVLDEVGQIEEQDDEAVALRDKANVALGYAWLQANQPANAKLPLQRVRMDGPFSSKALLGVGWADAEREDYRAALAPWVVLRERDLLDPAVQESLLAVPYAYARLGADGQAADYYTSAIDSFGQEIERIDAAIEAIRNGDLLATLLDHGKTDGTGWYWHLDEIPDTIESRYLYEMESTHAFQEGLKNYRDLLYLQRNLDEWSRSLTAFDDILDTKQRAYQQRLPLMDANLAAVDVAAMNERRVALESRLSSIERSGDFVALGTREQQALWDDLVGLEPQLAMLGTDGRAESLRGKQRFLKGLMIWDLSKSYNENLWRGTRALRDLDREVRSADRLELRVRTARDEWPAQFASQSARVATLGARVAGVKSTTQARLSQQQSYLERVAIEELNAQRARLGTYMVQARFSLAAIYDRAAANVPPGNPLGGGLQ